MDRPRYLYFGEVALDREEHTVLREGLKSRLQEEYWNALVHLIERQPESVSKEELFHVLGISSDGTLTKQIQRIREALGDTHRPFRFIQTERSRGYKWIAKLDRQISINTARVPSLYIHPNGHFQQEGPIWKEYRNDVPDKPFIFKELRRDHEYIYLYDETRRRDPGRPMYFRIPILGGVAQWTCPNPIQWEDCLIVEPQWQR
jgi:DNA-binding winged helix-turn-helix (wHTH) protein